ncbi:hypothetical protein cand_005970 [Cryptosporidium andersoni]|uniref:Carrier protein n=1 Tax=Cryptosporidium andersoni TaxID=117008 RepID=A0A1J4MQ59_9CRYT|nr:hypothetical protein cand_005970 [Cryptosporidium andersoni]
MNILSTELPEKWCNFKNKICKYSPPSYFISYPLYAAQLRVACRPYMNKGKKFKKDSYNSEINDILSNEKLAPSLNPANVISSYKLLKAIYNHEGFWGLYRGYIPSLIYVFLRDWIKKHMVYLEECSNSSKISEIIGTCSIYYFPKYIAEILAYPCLTIASQQTIFDEPSLKVFGDSLNKMEDYQVTPGNITNYLPTPTKSILSLIYLSTKSEHGLLSLWNGISMHLASKFIEDTVNLLSMKLLSKVKCNLFDEKGYEVTGNETNKLEKSNNETSNALQSLKFVIYHFSASLVSPITFISTIQRCQTDTHCGLCRTDIDVKQILGNINWKSYFSNLAMYSLIFIAMLGENQFHNLLAIPDITEQNKYLSKHL